MSDDLLMSVDPTAPPVLDPDIFEDEKPIEVLPEVKAATITDITKRIHVVKRMERKKEFFKESIRQMTVFYKQRIDTIEAGITEVKGQIRAYMEYNSLRNVPTTAGTAYQRSITEVEWDDDAAMIWLRSQSPELFGRLTRTKVELDKVAIKEFVKETGTEIPGITFTDKDKLYVR